MLICKTLSLDLVELKFDGEAGRFAGYASVFGGVDAYGDTIVRGAFESTLRKNGKPKMFYNHDWHMPIGKYPVAKEDDKGLFVEGEFTPGMTLSGEVRAAMKHGTIDGLSIGGFIKKGDYEETEGGRVIRRWDKLVEVSPVVFPADSAARIDAQSVKSMLDIESGLKQLNGAIDLHAGHMDGSIDTSDESQAEMMDMMVSAYTQIAGKKPTSMKSLDDLSTIRDFERFLRDAGGLSKGAAVALVARVKAILATGEPGEDADMKALRDALERIKERTA